MTTQPTWKLIANLGDTHPIEYGGYFVFEDTTGVYAPEVELLVSPETDDGTWTVYRFILEPCTFINGVLSDNKYHPDHPAWFADSMTETSHFTGISPEQFIEMITSDDTIKRALAWQAIGEYCGFDELDHYPLTLNREEVEARYASHPYVNESIA